MRTEDEPTHPSILLERIERKRRWAIAPASSFPFPHSRSQPPSRPSLPPPSKSIFPDPVGGEVWCGEGVVLGRVLLAGSQSSHKQRWQLRPNYFGCCLLLSLLFRLLHSHGHLARSHDPPFPPLPATPVTEPTPCIFTLTTTEQASKQEREGGRGERKTERKRDRKKEGKKERKRGTGDGGRDTLRQRYNLLAFMGWMVGKAERPNAMGMECWWEHCLATPSPSMSADYF